MKRIGRILPIAAILKSLATVDFVNPDYSVRVQVGFPRYEWRCTPHLNLRHELRCYVHRTDSRDITFPYLVVSVRSRCVRRCFVVSSILCKQLWIACVKIQIWYRWKGYVEPWTYSCATIWRITNTGNVERVAKASYTISRICKLRFCRTNKADEWRDK